MDHVAVQVIFITFLTSLQPITAQSSQIATYVRCDSGPCAPGHYFDKMKTSCELCPEGTFQPNLAHKCTSCIPCSEPNDFEEVVETCNGKADTMFTCIVGYFDAGSAGDRHCQKCMTCEQDEIVARPCGKRQDTKCMKSTTPLKDGTESAASDEDSDNNSDNGSGSWTKGSNHCITFIISSIGIFVSTFMLRGDV